MGAIIKDFLMPRLSRSRQINPQILQGTLRYSVLTPSRSSSRTRQMRTVLAALLACSISMPAPADMDIYKCPDGTFGNTTETHGPAYYEALGCKRLALTTDPVSSSNAQQVTIKRSPDGHFWMSGQINGKAIMFMVDTGATLVSVSDAFGASANLTGGRPIVLTTANGKRIGRVIEDVPVSASIFTVPNVNVAVGLSGLRPHEGLLGQNFLSHFEITMDERQMILRNKKR